MAHSVADLHQGAQTRFDGRVPYPELCRADAAHRGYLEIALAQRSQVFPTEITPRLTKALKANVNLDATRPAQQLGEEA